MVKWLTTACWQQCQPNYKINAKLYTNNVTPPFFITFTLVNNTHNNKECTFCSNKKMQALFQNHQRKAFFKITKQNTYANMKCYAL